MQETMPTPRNNEGNQDLAEMMKKLDAECRKCAPLNPVECVMRCNVWKIKNEFRKLRENIGDPDFTKKLLNALKNETRLHILKAIVRGQYSVGEIQCELKRTGCFHSIETINEEYLRPLLEVGLAAEAQEKYYATMLGGRLTEMLRDVPEFVDVLPAHSECHEETLLSMLLAGPKTFEDVETLISSKTASRIIKRLKTAGLITTSENRDYVFFFRSRRDPEKEILGPTEEKAYKTIPDEGISAKRLAENTDLSMRRTYKYLRGLKGKKLVFHRITPKDYRLTIKGERLALMLQNLQNLVEEVWNTSEQIARQQNS
jgi:predicted transcriptional regulator